MTYIGQPLKRFEDPILVKGEGLFVDDIKLPGMLHAAVLRSPYAYARIKSIHVSAAVSLQGVVSVITSKDIPDAMKLLPMHIRVRELFGDLSEALLHPVLAEGKVCYVGQLVAVLVAQDRYVAQDALDLIEVDYEPLAPILDPLEALGDDSEPIHPELGSNVGLRIYNEGGDWEAAVAQADRVVGQRYEVQRLAPVPMETRGLVADYRSQEDLLMVWSSTQDAHGVKDALTQLLSRPEEGVRVIAPDVGGGFGEKHTIFPEDILIPYLSQCLGRPVKWVADRQENMLTFHGRGYTIDVEAAVKKDGLFLGVRSRIVADLGAYYFRITPGIPMLTGHRITGPYKTPVVRFEVLGVITNKPPTGPYRGAGGPEASYCMERTVDLIAKELKLDPAEVRRKNFIAPEAFPYTTPTGITYDSGQYELGLERVMELSEYSHWREKSRESRKPGEPLIGVGLATVNKSSGGPRFILNDSARLIIEPSGRISAYTGVSPHGQGTETSFAQIVADELGILPSDVRVLHGDTDMIPFGRGTSASRGIILGGSALKSVLQDARQKLAKIASHVLKCPAEEVEFQQERVFNKTDPGQGISFDELAAAAYNEELLPPDVEAGLEFSGTYSFPDNPFSYAAHVAVVEVNRDTGDVKLLRYAAVHDCGHIINPMLVDGQAQGGIVQGIGQALTEGVMYTPDGQPLTASFMDYAMPIAEDMPDMLLENMETPSPTNLLGARGIGEMPTVAAPVAVANAVMDALEGTGVRHIDTPLTPEKIWRALHRGAGHR